MKYEQLEQDVRKAAAKVYAALAELGQKMQEAAEAAGTEQPGRPLRVLEAKVTKTVQIHDAVVFDTDTYENAFFKSEPVLITSGKNVIRTDFAGQIRFRARGKLGRILRGLGAKMGDTVRFTEVKPNEFNLELIRTK